MPYTEFAAWLNSDIKGLNDNIINALSKIPGGSTNLGNASTLITADPSDNTLANLYTQFTTWKTANPTFSIVSVTCVTGGDGETGLLVIYLT